MPRPSPTALVIDDEQQIRRFLRAGFELDGFSVLEAESAGEGLKAATLRSPDLILLDLGLPDMDGVELLERVRAWSEVPVIVLSVRSNEDEKVRALESGADDYVTKPFGPGELIARLAARLRAAPSELRFQFGGLTIDVGAHLVAIDGQEVHLTPIEFALLRVLVTSRGAVSHELLANKVWGQTDADPAVLVRTHIANLRAKLDHDQHRDLIRTEVGFGYRFARPDRAVVRSFVPAGRS